MQVKLAEFLRSASTRKFKRLGVDLYYKLSVLVVTTVEIVEDVGAEMPPRCFARGSRLDHSFHVGAKCRQSR